MFQRPSFVNSEVILSHNFTSTETPGSRPHHCWTTNAAYSQSRRLSHNCENFTDQNAV